ISSDGRFVVFVSSATNLLPPPGDTNGVDDVFVYDQKEAATERVSVGPGGVEGDAFSDDASISADGSFVVFMRTATTLLPPPGDNNGVPDVFVHDRQPPGITERVSVGRGPNGTDANGWSYNPRISADGRFVAFESSATNLVANDTNTC